MSWLGVIQETVYCVSEKGDGEILKNSGNKITRIWNLSWRTWIWLQIGIAPENLGILEQVHLLGWAQVNRLNCPPPLLKQKKAKKVEKLPNQKHGSFHNHLTKQGTWPHCLQDNALEEDENVRRQILFSFSTATKFMSIHEPQFPCGTM